jgi:hypothetical protein
MSEYDKEAKIAVLNMESHMNNIIISIKNFINLPDLDEVNKIKSNLFKSKEKRIEAHYLYEAE